MRVRNPDTRDALADGFLRSTGADLREGHGEAYYVLSHDFISMPAFAAFKGADHFYSVAFHELTHNAEPSVMPRRSGFARKRDQTDVAMRHNQSDSRKLSRASSGLYRPGRDVVDATRARAFSLRRMSACM
jgi:antirestriction protein ArdC